VLESPKFARTAVSPRRFRRFGRIHRPGRHPHRWPRAPRTVRFAAHHAPRPRR
jgi:hypothetical protein